MSTLEMTLALATAATAPAIFLGLVVGYVLKGRPSNNRPAPEGRKPLLASLAAGLTLWFFLDLMGAATSLGVNQGLSSTTTLVLAVLFAVGFLSTVLAEPSKKNGRVYDPVFLGAAIIGLHGIGEGIAIGATLTSTLDPVAAVGGPLSALSFVIHKGLEAFIVSVLLLDAGRYFSHIVVSALILIVPTVLGSLIGYAVSPNATVFYALGAGATVWLVSTLIAASLEMENRLRWCLAVLAGILIMFAAGTLHS